MNTGVGCHFLLQGTFPTQGSNPGLPHYRQMLYCPSYQGSHSFSFYYVNREGNLLFFLTFFQKMNFRYVRVTSALWWNSCPDVCRKNDIEKDGSSDEKAFSWHSQGRNSDWIPKKQRAKFFGHLLSTLGYLPISCDLFFQMLRNIILENNFVIFIRR